MLEADSGPFINLLKGQEFSDLWRNSGVKGVTWDSWEVNPLPTLWLTKNQVYVNLDPGTLGSGVRHHLLELAKLSWISQFNYVTSM